LDEAAEGNGSDDNFLQKIRNQLSLTREPILRLRITSTTGSVPGAANAREKG
jgi:hypothetical protein